MVRFLQINKDDIIEELLESSTIRVIDYIPYYPSDEAFLELEAYYEKTKLKGFSSKIADILLKLKYYTPSYVQLAEETREIECSASQYPVGQDIYDLAPEQFADVVEDIVVRDYTTLNVLLLEYNVLIAVSGGFSVTIYGDVKEELLTTIKELVQQEGLFLKTVKV